MQPHLDHHPPDGFPTDPSGLPEAGRPRPLELADGDTLKLRIAPVAKTPRRRHRADAGLQRLHPRPHPQGRPGQRGRGPRREPRRPGRDRALARAAAGKPIRRRATRDPGADPGGRGVHLPGPVPRRGPVLVPPPHPGGLHPGAGPVRQHPGRPRRPRLLVAGRPRRDLDAGRPAGGGRQGRAVQPHRDQLCGHGPLRQRLLDRRRPGPAAEGQRRGRWCGCG